MLVMKFMFNEKSRVILLFEKCGNEMCWGGFGMEKDWGGGGKFNF